MWRLRDRQRERGTELKLVATWTDNPTGSEKYLVLGRDETCVVTVTLSQTSDAAPVPILPSNAAKPAELSLVDPCPRPRVVPSVRALVFPRRGEPVPFTPVELAFDSRTRKYRARFVLGGAQT